MPAWQLAPALHENEPPPFSSRLHELAVLHTPAGKTLKYLTIQDVSTMYEFCMAMGTACSQCTVMSLIRMALGTDAMHEPLTLKSPGCTASGSISVSGWFSSFRRSA